MVDASIIKKNIKIVIPITILMIVVLLCICISFVQSDNNDSTTLLEENISKSYQDNQLEDIEESIPRLSNENSIISNNISDPLFDELIQEGTEIEMQRLEATEKVPVHEWRLALLENMKNEDIKQTIEHLANFDDDMFASSTINDTGTANVHSKLVTRLMRVRKLYSIGLKNPELIIPELRQAQKEYFEKWPEAFNQLREDLKNNQNSYSKPNGYMRAEYSCLAATYLLAEFHNYDILPQLSEQYKKHHIWPPPQLPSPVAPSMTFYAIHRLVSTYPRASLSKEAIKVLDEYLEASKEIVPDPEQIKVSLFDDYYTEFDPTLDIAGVKKEILEGRPYMTMPLYPTKFTDGTELQDGNGVKSEKMNELFNKLDAFVQIVYPPEKKSSSVKLQ